MDETPGERLVVHLDDYADLPHGKLIDRAIVAEALHVVGESSEFCWCQPLVISPAETRSAIELIDDWFATTDDRSQ